MTIMVGCWAVCLPHRGVSWRAAAMVLSGGRMKSELGVLSTCFPRMGYCRVWDDCYCSLSLEHGKYQTVRTQAICIFATALLQVNNRNSALTGFSKKELFLSSARWEILSWKIPVEV